MCCAYYYSNSRSSSGNMMIRPMSVGDSRSGRRANIKYRNFERYRFFDAILRYLQKRRYALVRYHRLPCNNTWRILFLRRAIYFPTDNPFRFCRRSTVSPGRHSSSAGQASQQHLGAHKRASTRWRKQTLMKTPRSSGGIFAVASTVQRLSHPFSGC